MKAHLIRLAIVLALLSGLGLASGCGTSPSPGDSTPGGSAESTAAEETTGPATSAETTGGTEVMTYFVGPQEVLVPVQRLAPSPSVAADAVISLLEGPTDAERTADLVTEIPEGTLLRALKIEEGLATVDLTSQFTEGGGTFSMTGRVAQMVYTLTQFPTVQRVTFLVEGRPLDVLGGEGIILDRPQTRDDYGDFAPDTDEAQVFE